MEPANSDDPGLDDLCMQLDSMDHELRILLERRFRVVEQLRNTRNELVNGGTGDPLPVPCSLEETARARHLLEARQDPLPARLLITLWRHITAETAARLTAMKIHCPLEVLETPQLRDAVRAHYGAIGLTGHDDCATALKAAATVRHDVCIVPATAGWPGLVADGVASGGPGAVATLPFLSPGGPPDLIILGHARQSPSGHDETLLATAGHLPRDFPLAPLWVCETSDGQVLTSLPGFLSPSEVPLIGLVRGNDSLALRVLGRYPSPFEL